MIRPSLKQWFQIFSALNSSFVTATALFTPFVSQGTALKIIAAFGIANIIVNSVGSVLFGQDFTVKEVLNMPGVQHIDVNEKANSTLAKLAVDQNVNKIAPARGAFDAVTKIANGH